LSAPAPAGLTGRRHPSFRSDCQLGSSRCRDREQDPSSGGPQVEVRWDNADTDRSVRRTSRRWERATDGGSRTCRPRRHRLRVTAAPIVDCRPSSVRRRNGAAERRVQSKPRRCVSMAASP
jgi:hypothetical protein